MSSPKRRPTQQEADAIIAHGVRLLARRIACAQALRDGRRPVSGALNDTRAEDAEQEDAYTN